ncbi:MAG TPA: hypothetical protein VEY69_09580, partial [Lautropia sp.]|nr:hypothetical protein [Lautropia sp.]
MMPALRNRGAPSRLSEGVIAAPIGGINTISAGGAMPATDCIQAVNLIAAEYGLRTRLGSREWCTGLDAVGNLEVRSILPFTGSAKNGAADRLFACTTSGIWNVSSSSAAPLLVLAFSTQSGEAGFGVSHGMVTSAGHFLLYCDEENGYHVYSESSGTWAKVTMGTAAGQVAAAASTTPASVDPANFVYVTVFKNRVFFVEKNSARAWYLPAGAVFGGGTTFGVQPLNLGQVFKAGGPLVGLWNWTLDAGAGLDDQLVAVSGGGDVAIYAGTDP